MYLFQAYFNYNTSFLLIISLTSLLLGLSIIVTKNPILSVLFLIGLFIGIAIYLVLLGLNFIGLSYLLVYVGAISILFLFILMLINIRISELLTEGKNSLPLATLTVLFFNYAVNPVLPYNTYVSNISIDITDKLNNFYHYYKTMTDSNYQSDLYNVLFTFLSDSIGMVKNNGWDGLLVGVTHIGVIGNLLYAAFYIFLIIISLVLLLAMVGAIIITLNKSNVKNTSISNLSFLDLNYLESKENLDSYGNVALKSDVGNKKKTQLSNWLGYDIFTVIVRVQVPFGL